MMSKLACWAPIPLRLIVGYGFFAHGYAKLLRGPDNFINILTALGVPAPELMAWATILVEVVGGIAILIGAFVPLFAVPMIIILLVATFTVHIQNGFSSIKLQTITANGPQFGQPGYEADLLYLACIVTLLLIGSGPLSVDGLLAKNRAQR
jgi:putative oxidoreductase